MNELLNDGTAVHKERMPPQSTKSTPREYDSSSTVNVQSYSLSAQDHDEDYPNNKSQRRGDVNHANQMYLRPRDSAGQPEPTSRPGSSSMLSHAARSMGPMLADDEGESAPHYDAHRRGDVSHANQMYLAQRFEGNKDRDHSRPNSSSRAQLGSGGGSQGRRWDTSSNTRDETLKQLEQQSVASLVQNRHATPDTSSNQRYDTYEDSFERESFET